MDKYLTGREKKTKSEPSQCYPRNAQGAMGTVKYRKLCLNTTKKLLYSEGGLKKRASGVSILRWRIFVNLEIVHLHPVKGKIT